MACASTISEKGSPWDILQFLYSLRSITSVIFPESEKKHSLNIKFSTEELSVILLYSIGFSFKATYP